MSTVHYTGPRDGCIESEAALVFTRAELDKAMANTNEARLNTKVNNPEFLMSQSENPNDTTEDFKKWVEETCLTPEAIHGGGNSKFQCPLIYLGYNNALKFQYGSTTG